MARSKHRTGGPYRRLRQEMFARWGTVCSICGHSGAGDMGHVGVPLSKLPAGTPLTVDMVRPQHGVRSRCPACPGPRVGVGRACNQVHGAKGPDDDRFRPALRW